MDLVVRARGTPPISYLYRRCYKTSDRGIKENTREGRSRYLGVRPVDGLCHLPYLRGVRCGQVVHIFQVKHSDSILERRALGRAYDDLFENPGVFMLMQTVTRRGTYLDLPELSYRFPPHHAEYSLLPRTDCTTRAQTSGFALYGHSWLLVESH